MSLVVAQPGLYSLLVDAGRPRSRSLGVPVGGAADRAAWQLANALIGNPPNALALEITLAGPTLLAETDTACVVFGAPFQMHIDGETIPPGMTFTLRAGQTLCIGGTPMGVRGYLTVRGGFSGPSVLGSASGWKPIERGAVLPCEASTTAGRCLPFHHLLGTGDAEILRVLTGPQADWFLDDAFYRDTYTVSPASNRMGIRLTGPALTKRAGEMASEPVAPGAVQVTNDGLPILLGVDGQTIGGYPKPAHIIRTDLDKLAQLRPGARVRFLAVTIQEAESLAAEREAELQTWLHRLRWSV